MKGLEICHLGCYGLMMKVFGLDPIVIVMMERPSQILKVKNNKRTNNNLVQTKIDSDV
jgi:hypothetical protein